MSRVDIASASHDSWNFHLKPSHNLPQIDLSATLKTRCLSLRNAARLTSILTALGSCKALGSVVAITSYFIVFIVSVQIGRYISIGTTILALPGFLAPLTVLCVDVVRLVIACYDTAYFWLVSVITYSSVVLMVGDARACIVVISFIGWHLNLFVDAAVRQLRTIAFCNCLITLGTVSAAVCIAFGAVPRTHNFVLVQFSHEHFIDAKTVASNGLLTLAAILARNVYRHRAHLFVHRNVARRGVVECATYRCQLQFIEQLRTELPVAPLATEYEPTAEVEVGPSHVSLIVQMRYVPLLPTVDARNVAFRRGLQWLIRMRGSAGPLLSIVPFISGVLIVLICGSPSVKSSKPQLCKVLEATALSLTLFYMLVCAALLQRQLCVAVVSCFDFLFPVAQISLLILSLGDMLDTQGPSIPALLVVWLWSLWIFCLDALTPPVRRHLGIYGWLSRLIATTLIAALIYAGYLVIKTLTQAKNAPELNHLHNRVLWQGVVFGRAYSIRLVAVFANCYATSITWGLRLWWRIWRASLHDLVVVDGPIEYDNVLIQRKQRNARQG
ncbi:hypothetical protein PINS_up002194 [Pythium insidiosum]|nr:hypothetical protein PINS_up002194 [Pythium insidiosum]